MYMGIGKLSLLLTVFLLSISFISALDDVDKVYFQQQNEKLIAQVNSKIDTQTAKIEGNMKSAVDNAKSEIKNEMTNEIKGSLRAVAIGLAGLIIVTLAIFKVIDLKISSTRNIKKYEAMMQQKGEELDKLILQAQVERNELSNARMQLSEYQKRLSIWEKELQGKHQQVNQVMAQYNMPQPYQQQVINQPNVGGQSTLQMQPKNGVGTTQYNNPAQNYGQYPQGQFPQNVPPPPELKVKTPIWKTAIIIILVIAVLGLLGIAIYKFMIAPQ
jgi:hypothetical protein